MVTTHTTILHYQNIYLDHKDWLYIMPGFYFLMLYLYLLLKKIQWC